MPKISFVMPTKNRDKLIGKSIQSIIDQTIVDWELVIVDDHSDAGDETESVVRQFDDDRIKYFRMSDKRSGGIAEARNFGNQLASAPIVAVADSDDLQLKDRAKIVIETFEDKKWDVFYGKYLVYDQEKDTTEEAKNEIIEFDLEELKSRNYIAHGSTAYRREISYDYPYNSFFKIGEDYDLFTRLAKSGMKFYFHNDFVYKYVIHGENISGGKKFSDYEDLILSNRCWKEIDRNNTLNNIFNNEK